MVMTYSSKGNRHIQHFWSIHSPQLLFEIRQRDAVDSGDLPKRGRFNKHGLHSCVGIGLNPPFFGGKRV